MNEDVVHTYGRPTPGARSPSRGTGRAAKANSSPATRLHGPGRSHPSGKPLRAAVEPTKRSGGIEAAGAPISLTTANATSTALVVRDLRPRQVVAATLLVQGRQGKEVATMVGVAEETISRWRQQPEFQALMHQLLQETVDATKLGLVSLCAESVEHLRGLIRAFDDKTALKAISLILGKVGPVLSVIGAEMRQPMTRLDPPPQNVG